MINRGVMMKLIDIKKLSNKYQLRKLNQADVDMIYAFCKANTQYYEYCGKENSKELIEQDLELTPPGISAEQKYYVGFFEKEKLVAIMDLIDGYPDEDYAYIGFFMVNSGMQGVGEGSKIISEVFEYLQKLGFEKCMLAIDKDNPQSNHFWKKNGFEIIREVEIETGVVLVAERKI